MLLNLLTSFGKKTLARKNTISISSSEIGEDFPLKNSFTVATGLCFLQEKETSNIYSIQIL